VRQMEMVQRAEAEEAAKQRAYEEAARRAPQSLSYNRNPVACWCGPARPLRTSARRCVRMHQVPGFGADWLRRKSVVTAARCV
jgi:hypothetical protein